MHKLKHCSISVDLRSLHSKTPSQTWQKVVYYKLYRLQPHYRELSPPQTYVWTNKLLRTLMRTDVDTSSCINLRDSSKQQQQQRQVRVMLRHHSIIQSLLSVTNWTLVYSSPAVTPHECMHMTASTYILYRICQHSNLSVAITLPILPPTYLSGIGLLNYISVGLYSQRTQAPHVMLCPITITNNVNDETS